MKKYVLPIFISLFLTGSVALAADNIPQIVNFLVDAMRSVQKDVVTLKAQDKELGQKISNLDQKISSLDQKFTSSISTIQQKLGYFESLTNQHFADIDAKIKNLEEGLKSAGGLKVYDATGKMIGYLIDWNAQESAGKVTVFDPSMNKIYSLYLDGQFSLANAISSNGTYYQFGSFLYQSGDCTGSVLANGKISPYHIAFYGPLSDQFYASKSFDDILQNVLIKSIKKADGTCISVDNIETYATYIQPVTLPVYQGPLEIKP